MMTIGPQARSRIMRAIKSKNTRPELAVRRALHAAGYRFRLHRADLPGKPDIVLPKYGAVIFMHGCFWHQHPNPECRNAQVPRSNQAYWSPKLSRTVERDEQAARALQDQGWKVLTIWECEVPDAAALDLKLRKFLG